MLKAIHAQESRDAADRKARAIVDDLRTARMNTAADLVERSVSETLTYYAFPDIHWQKIRTNNPLERIMREIRRRTRVVGAFPDGQSCLNLAAARLPFYARRAFRRPKPRSATTPYWKSQPWRRDSNQTASGKPGAVHTRGIGQSTRIFLASLIRSGTEFTGRDRFTTSTNGMRVMNASGAKSLVGS